MKLDQFRFLDYEKLKRIVDNAYDEIFVYDNNYKIIYVNKACKRHYGMKQEEIIGDDFFNLLSEDKWYPSLLPMVYKEKRQLTIEQTSYIGKKLITTAVPLFDEDGQIEFVVMSVYDSSCNLVNQRLMMEEAYKNKKNNGDEFSVEELEDEGDIFFKSEKMKQIIKFTKNIAKFDSTVLIHGESGTGKTMLAKYIHDNSKRKSNSFLSINCSAIPEQLLESELFGYVEGAFTGAKKAGKTGLIELACGGTILLDEIGELSLPLQAKILHVIQEKSYIPIGSNKIKKADVRIISATNKNLLEQVRKKAFREDLFWRLNVIDVEIPALRNRKEDINILSEIFLRKFNKKHNSNKKLSNECMEFFISYDWPGNIRQLQNLIERLVITSESHIITKENIPKFMFEKLIMQSDIKENKGFEFEEGQSFDLVVEKFEEDIIKKMYQKHNSTRKLAQVLKISQSKSSRLIRKYITK
ncbi:MAG: sigma 54-interacting transcriptional regulator [Peptostreptococcaceae bacterium]|jgi:PAS domain S-box-containing protein/TyrR family helix-turn-helix protein|nr:sigma 54-interacting transcriptional regulator [Peptostreptococcaceae bacterium]